MSAMSPTSAGRYVYEPLRDAAVMRHAVGAMWEWDAANAVCLIHGDAHYGFVDWQMAEDGCRPPSFEEVWDTYRRHLVHGLFHTANADEMYPKTPTARSSSDTVPRRRI
jgi:hypothetical protein